MTLRDFVDAAAPAPPAGARRGKQRPASSGARLSTPIAHALLHRQRQLEVSEANLKAQLSLAHEDLHEARRDAASMRLQRDRAVMALERERFLWRSDVQDASRLGRERDEAVAQQEQWAAERAELQAALADARAQAAREAAVAQGLRRELHGVAADLVLRTEEAERLKAQLAAEPGSGARRAAAAAEQSVAATAAVMAAVVAQAPPQLFPASGSSSGSGLGCGSGSGSGSGSGMLARTPPSPLKLRVAGGT